MKCREVEEALMTKGAGGTNTSLPPLRAHINECRIFQERLRILELSLKDTKIDSSTIERLQRIIVDDLYPVRPLLPSWVFLLGFLLIFAGLNAFGAFFLGAAGWLVLMPIQKIVVFSTLLASATLLAFSLVRLMVPGHKSLRPGLLPVGVFVLLCLVVAVLFQVRTDPHSVRAGEACVKAGAPYAISATIMFSAPCAEV